MNTILAFSFDESSGGRESLERIKELDAEGLLKLRDAIVVNRKENGELAMDQMHNLVARGAVSGGALGAFVGLLMLHPLVGIVTGAALGAISGAFEDVGIDDAFAKGMSSKLEPGHSALFLMVSDMREARVLEELRGMRGEVLHTSFDSEQDSRWREVLRGRHPQPSMTTSQANSSQEVSA